MPYIPTVWYNSPTRTTPVNATRLNKLETQHAQAVADAAADATAKADAARSAAEAFAASDATTKANAAQAVAISTATSANKSADTIVDGTVNKVLTAANKTALTNLQANLDSKINSSLIGSVNGVAPLDSTSKIASSYLPPVAITDTFVVASEAAMLALSATTGDIAVRTDVSKNFILQGANPTVLGNWVELASAVAVSSVAGRTGSVVLNADDISDTSTTKKFTNAADIARLAQLDYAINLDTDGVPYYFAV